MASNGSNENGNTSSSSSSSNHNNTAVAMHVEETPETSDGVLLDLKVLQRSTKEFGANQVEGLFLGTVSSFQSNTGCYEVRFDFGFATTMSPDETISCANLFHQYVSEALFFLSGPVLVLWRAVMTFLWGFPVPSLSLCCVVMPGHQRPCLCAVTSWGCLAHAFSRSHTHTCVVCTSLSLDLSLSPSLYCTLYALKTIDFRFAPLRVCASRVVIISLAPWLGSSSSSSSSSLDWTFCRKTDRHQEQYRPCLFSQPPLGPLSRAPREHARFCGRTATGI